MPDSASSTLSATVNQQPLLVDPFACFVSHAVDTLGIPKPCAQFPPRTLKGPVPQDEALAATSLQYTVHGKSGSFYLSASIPSAGESSTLTAMAPIDFEKGATNEEDMQHGSSQRNSAAKDPEKAFSSAQPINSNRSLRQPQCHSGDDAASITFSDVESEIEAGLALQELMAIKILFFLSGPVVGLSFLNLFWTLVSLAITTLSQPVRLCAHRITYGQQLASLLGPALSLQLKCIYTPLPPNANEDGVFHPGMLVFVLLVSPVLSLGVAIAGWVVAAYWLLAAIVGDPAGMDKRDDGRENVLRLRSWCENTMLKAFHLD